MRWVPGLDSLPEISSRLPDRDRVLALLDDHEVLTTQQITAMLFSSVSSCLDRTPTAHAVRERQDRLVASPRLEHLVGANQFFTDLIAHGRGEHGNRLVRWWSEWRTAATLHQRIHPDGHGLWSDGRHAGDYDHSS